jgi:hypothetical protein
VTFETRHLPCVRTFTVKAERLRAEVVAREHALASPGGLETCTFPHQQMQVSFKGLAFKEGDLSVTKREKL